MPLVRGERAPIDEPVGVRGANGPALDDAAVRGVDDGEHCGHLHWATRLSVAEGIEPPRGTEHEAAISDPALERIAAADPESRRIDHGDGVPHSGRLPDERQHRPTARSRGQEAPGDRKEWILARSPLPRRSEPAFRLNGATRNRAPNQEVVFEQGDQGWPSGSRRP